MLIECPECKQKISDKAFMCPHCGLPLNQPANITTPRTHSSQVKRRKLPNGFGQITKIQNKNLKNKYRVMITVSKSEDGKPICKLLKPKAYFATYEEAFDALVKYNESPYKIDEIETVQDLFKRWSKECFRVYSPNSVRALNTAWNACSKVKDLRLSELDLSVLDDLLADKPSDDKRNMIILFSSMLDYGINHEIVESDITSEIVLKKDTAKSYMEFNERELEILWNNLKNFEYTGYVLFQCYSGLKPMELCMVNITDVFLEDSYLIAGLKNQTGKSRIVPIHPKVKIIIEKAYERAKDLKSSYLFTNLKSKPGQNPKLAYTTYKTIFEKLIKELRLDPFHRILDPRKTFIYLAEKYKVNPFVLKRILGLPTDKDSELLYTDISVDLYFEELQKIK